MTTGWCKSNSGVMQDQLSYLPCQRIRKCDEQLCAWNQIGSDGKGWYTGMEEPSGVSIYSDAVCEQ